MTASARPHAPRTPLTAALLGVGCAGAIGCAGAPPTGPDLVPVPREVETVSGSFTIGPTTRVAVADAADAELVRVVEQWAVPIRDATGFPLPIGAEGDIRIAVEPGGAPESYRLSVDDDRISLLGADHAGVFYGLQTVDQLLPPGVGDGVAVGSAEAGGSVRSARVDGGGSPAVAGRPPLTVPAVRIEDAPRFPYRGMHLDVARHFFGPEYVKRYIDALARYKVNHFHWHLTEDQGWRIEIDRYPRLTEVGAWRAETHVGHGSEPYRGDGRPYGGFYTKEEIRDIVAYAAERYVTIVPEIEMPGHSTAALAAYPGLACTEGPFEVATSWGVFDDIFCPTEETFDFLEGVLTEVMELFPGPYIHVGGDEAPKTRWEESEVAQAIIEREGLADEDELQAWFIGRIGRFLDAHGRRLLGWDEILEGGLPEGATVMSWRGTEGGIEAARQGHDVVMTPTTHMYFDYYQGRDTEREPLAIGGYLPLERVHAFEPVPEELNGEEAGHVIGVQANVWTEYMRTWDHVEYMVFPRFFALSEVAWSPATARSHPDFYRRLGWHLRRLDRLDVGYRIPEVLGLERDRLTLGDELRVELAAPVGEIRYTLSGDDPGGPSPDASSPVYSEPLELDLRGGGATVSAWIEMPDGRSGPVRSARFERADAVAAASVDPAALEPGFCLEMVEGRFARVSEMAEAEVRRRARVGRVAIPEWAPEEGFGLRFRGYVRVPADGVYTVRLTSDDGAVVRLADRVVVDHDGPHGPSTRSGQAALAEGHHPIEVEYFQVGGGRALDVEWSADGVSWEPVEGWAGPLRENPVGRPC